MKRAAVFLVWVAVGAVLTYALGEARYKAGFAAGFAEGWQSYIDNKPPNPPPTKCRWRTDDGSKCKVWKDRT